MSESLNTNNKNKIIFVIFLITVIGIIIFTLFCLDKLNEKTSKCEPNPNIKLEDRTNITEHNEISIKFRNEDNSDNILINEVSNEIINDIKNKIN